MLNLNNYYLPKDFIETTDGLMFAVVQAGLEHCQGQDKVLCFLRYIRSVDGLNQRWQKVETGKANEYLKINFPGYIHHSSVLDTNLHAIEVDRVYKHYQPKQRLQTLLQQLSFDTVERDCYDLCRLYLAEGIDLTRLGVTGSLLIGSQQASSDIDIVIYDRQLFHIARKITAKLISQGKLSMLRLEDWHEAYHRRACSLSFDEYVWHEQRKLNKAMINDRKFDLNFVSDKPDVKAVKYHKLGSLTLECTVTNADHAYDFPAQYHTDHPVITTAVCFTATYNGQALAGERILVSGLLEQDDNGVQRIVVGSNREAPGEYIKVAKCPA